MNACEILARESTAAISLYESEGVLLPKLFATGRRRSIAAEPKLGADQSDAARARLLAAMTIATNARVIGRCDEVWATSDLSLRDTPLAGLADTDPRVRTAIACAAIDMSTFEGHGCLLEPFLDDEGRQRWRACLLSDHAAERIMDLLDMSLDLVTDDSVEEIAESIGWRIAERDETGEEARRG